jgi:protein ImuB
VTLDLRGTEKIFGNLQETARKISEGARQRGFDLSVALASNPDTALYAARGFSGVTVVPAGREAACLSSLPVAILPIEPEMLDVLESWGIRTLKTLAALPELPLTERLGQAGLYLQRLAQGRVRRTLVPVEAPSTFVASCEFEDPVEILESLAFLLHRLIQQICDQLAAHSLATHELRLTLDLKVLQRKDGSDGEQYRREWKLPVPTQDSNTLFALVRLGLESISLTAPVRRVTLEAMPVRPRMAQSDLFAPPSPETEKLEITLTRLRGVVGVSDATGVPCVGSPGTVDTHRPDAFAVRPFSSTAASSADRPAKPILAPRIFRPALETSVELRESKPHSVRLWKTQRRVLTAFGPWCTSGNWWNSATAWVREEWDVVLKTVEGAGYYRIYEDRISHRWFVEAVFD